MKDIFSNFEIKTNFGILNKVQIHLISMGIDCSKFVSKRGVPILRIDHKMNLVFFKRTKTFRLFTPIGTKAVDYKLSEATRKHFLVELCHIIKEEVNGYRTTRNRT